MAHSFLQWNAIVALLSAGVLGAGCTSLARAPAAPNLPAAFEHAGAGTGAWPGQDWYEAFSSAELNEFIADAGRSNFDLAIARTRLLQANARAVQAGAALLPSIDAGGTANFLAGHSSHGGGHELDWSAMLSASYEMDFWGKNRAIAKSAGQLARAAQADRDSVMLTTLAGVADSYFQLLGLRERLQIARLNQTAAQQLLDVVQARFAAGVATPVEQATQRATVDTAQIASVELHQQVEESQAALALLLGRSPEQFEVRGAPLDTLTEPQVFAGLPSELLRRRPDISAAEANLEAGHADLLVARAAMFPSFSLTGSAGVQNPALPATVLTIPGVGPSFGLGANLLQPIFDHRRLQAQRNEVDARDQELLATYRASIIAALVDVENALAAKQHLDSARDFQIDNVAQSERAFEGAQARYRAGSGDFPLLLEAQRALYSARDQFIQYKLARLQALVSLAKALGGGWSQPRDENI